MGGHRAAHRWLHHLGMVGMLCGSLCFLGVPLLAVALAALGVPWAMSDGLWAAMLAMSALMFGAAALGNYLRHRNPRPLALGACAAILLACAVLVPLPKAFGWVGLAGLVGSWAWDGRLARHSDEASRGC